MNNIDSIKAKYIRQINEDYRYRRKISGTNPNLIQDGPNCWIYASTQEAYRNGVGNPDIDTIKKNLSAFGFYVNKGGDKTNSLAVVCDVLKDKHVIYGGLSLIKDIDLIAKMMREGYRFVISRRAYVDLAVDVREDGDLDFVDGKAEGDGRHATLIGRDPIKKRVVEDGNWEPGSLMDNFPWDTHESIKKSVLSGGIREICYFLDIDPNFR